MLVANAWILPSTLALRIRGRPLSHPRMSQVSGIHQNTVTPFHHSTATVTSKTTILAGRTRRLLASTSVIEGESSSSSQSAPSTPTIVVSSNTNWKESPLVNPTIAFETLLVPNSQLTKWITHKDLQHRLAKPDNWEFLKHVHPRIKMVQDYEGKDDDSSPTTDEESSKESKRLYKQLLLLPSSLSLESVSNHTATGITKSKHCREGENSEVWLSKLLSEEDDDVRRGPSRPMSLSPNQLSFSFLLKRLLPESALPAPSAYEQIGHVAHFNLKEKHLPFKELIGSALLESTSGDSIQTVVNKVGQVDGKFRTYECEILANEFQSSSNSNQKASSLETTVVEDGISIELNVAECYWCTRLSGERQELIKDILRGRMRPKKGLVSPPVVVADVFCGAGAVCMLLAKKVKEQDKIWKPEQQQNLPPQQHPSLTILGNDWNPRAIEYMKRSIATNGMDKEKDESLYHQFQLSCRDSYDFLSELGEEQQSSKANPYIKKSLLTGSQSNEKLPEPQQEQQEQAPLMPDHVLMNFPLEAPQFLGALRWWSWKRLRDEGLRRSELFSNGTHKHGKKKPSESTWSPRFHIYTFARSSSPRANDEDEMAVNLVANELLPQPVFPEYENDTEVSSTYSNSAFPSSFPTTIYRREELNSEFGTEFSTRIVRDVAPGKVVVCVSFSVTPKLIRYMQGDYS